MQHLQSPRIGALVIVRQQRWRVVDIQAHPACNVISLAGAAARNAGRVAQVIAPFDLVEPAVAPSGIQLVGARQWRQRCRTLMASLGPADRLQTAVEANIDLLPHQLEPALAIVQGRACRVLIADAVGLGKTIQAGLIVAELRARQAADRVLVLTPAGLREQWVSELHARFGIDAAVIDMRGARLRGATLPIGVNPWSTFDVAVASFDYVKRPEVAPAVTACRWDLVVVDEAHGVTTGSDRRAVVDTLCRQASYVVLLTATPHSGSRSAFRSLCAIGAQPSDRLLVFRRNRGDAGLTARRSVHRLFVRLSSQERDMHARVADLMRAATAESHRSRDVWLAMSVIVKRSLSSAYALEETLARRLRVLASTSSDASLQLCLPLTDATGELDASDESPVVMGPLLRNTAGERRLVTGLADCAASATRAESKLRRLERLLTRLGRLREPSIVFTEYRDTLLHLRRSLPFDCAVLHGGLAREERRTELDSFSNGERPVLLATDAGSEGLNLHMACRVVINLELPWNPMRLEQRIGRVDRIGQTRRVHVFHLVARKTPESRILESLKAKIARARADIDAADPLGFSQHTCEDAVTVRRLAGLEAEDVSSEDQGGVAAFFTLVRLEADAAREARRLNDARRFLRRHSASHLLDEGWYATATRRGSTRLALGGRCLVMAQDRVSSDHGRLIASRLLPFLVTVRREPAAGHRRRRLSALVEAAHRVEARSADTGWHVDMQRVHRLFVGARIERDSAIVASLDTEAAPAQAGLFERRSLREAADRAARIEELKGDVSNRIAAFRASTTQTSSAATVLILIPAERW